MKKLILLAIAALFLDANSNAQAQRHMPEHQHMTSDSAHHFQTGKMMENLNLTADQKTQMKALRQELQQQRKAIQNDTSLSTDQKKEKMKELHETQMQRMNSILTPDQQAKMNAFRSQGKGNSNINRSDSQMMRQLVLTTDQKIQMKSLREDMQQQKNAIKNDTTLSAEQKKEKLKALSKTQMQRIDAILTPEQQAKMKVIREQRKQNHLLQKKHSKMSQGEKP